MKRQTSERQRTMPRLRLMAILMTGGAAAGAGAGACARAPAGDPVALARGMLNRSAGAWNRGDLAGFMEDYLADSTTTFVSGGHVRYGFDWIRRNYEPTFTAGAAHDSLRFEEVAARWLGTAHLLATARYVLFRGDSIVSSGPFTLILQRNGDAWKIIHDHTSRD